MDWNVAVVTVRAQATAAFYAKPCLECSGLQVITGMNDAAVSPALMKGGFCFLLQHKNSVPKVCKVNSGASADSSSADDDNVGVEWPRLSALANPQLLRSVERS